MNPRVVLAIGTHSHKVLTGVHMHGVARGGQIIGIWIGVLDHQHLTLLQGAGETEYLASDGNPLSRVADSTDDQVIYAIKIGIAHRQMVTEVAVDDRERVDQFNHGSSGIERSAGIDEDTPGWDSGHGALGGTDGQIQMTISIEVTQTDAAAEQAGLRDGRNQLQRCASSGTSI